MINTRKENHISLLLAVLVLIFAVGVFSTFQEGLHIVFTDHALKSHEAQRTYIDNCYENGDIYGPFQTSGGRLSEYCNDGGENNYWRIFECVEGEKIVITQFKQGVTRLANYMLNHNMVEAEELCH